MLLKHDGIIYGPFIRDILTNKYNELNNMSYNLNVIMIHNYKKIIERNLFNVIEDKIDYNEAHGPLKGGDKIDYILKRKINNNLNYIRVIRIYYVSEILSFEKNGLLKDHEKYILLDINCIGITRNGIKIIGEQDHIPNPFYNILKNIEYKEFSINGQIKDSFDLDILYDYIDLGWKLKNRKITEEEGTRFSEKDEVCNICMEEINTSDIVYKLPCNHFYHKECWKKNVYEHIKSYFTAGTYIYEKHKTVKCPYCREEYKIKEVL